MHPSLTLTAQQASGIPRSGVYRDFRSIYDSLVITQFVQKQKGDLAICCLYLYYVQAKKRVQYISMSDAKLEPLSYRNCIQRTGDDLLAVSLGNGTSHNFGNASVVRKKSNLE